MKNSRLIILSIIGLLIVWSCQEDNMPTPLKEGYLRFDVGIEVEESGSGRTQTVNTDDFRVSIFTDDSVLVRDFPRFIDIPDSIILPVGSYFAEASSNNQVNAAFETPFYFGSSPIFNIDQGGFQTVTIDTELANTQVSFVFSQNVLQDFDIYEGTVKIRNTSDSLFYQTGEMRSGYFATKPLDIQARIAYYQPDSTLVEETFTASIDNPKPRTHYRLNLDATVDGGQISVQINVDESVDLVEITPVDGLNRTIGGLEDDVPTEIIETSDGGFIVVGRTSSNSGDFVGQLQGRSDGVVIKYSAQNELEWQKVIGNSFFDGINSVDETLDGGYILGGGSSSAPNGDGDAWVVKLDRNGNVAWQKTFGGSGIDFIESIIQTNDGGYIFSAYSNSNDGDVLANRGGFDFWIVKLNDIGAIQWQRSYGGSSDDFPRVIRKLQDGGYVVGGTTLSVDGNVSRPIGLFDFWILRLDINGNLLWEKTEGGTRSDRINDLELTFDGAFIIVGASESNIGELNDFLVIRMSDVGTVQLKKKYKGSANDFPYSVQQLPNNGYLIVGDTFSSDGDVPSNNGSFDLWAIQISSNGTLEWSQTYGGSSLEQGGRGFMMQNGEMVFTSGSASGDGDVPNNKGLLDFWIFRTDQNGNL